MKNELAKESKEYFEKVSKVKVGKPFIDEGVLKGTHMGNGWLCGPWQCNKCMKMVPADHSGCPWCSGAEAKGRLTWARRLVRPIG